MATFAELQVQLRGLKARKEIFTYLITHIDGDFRPAGDATTPAKFLLITGSAEKTLSADFEQVCEEFTAEVRVIDEEIARVMNANLSPEVVAKDK